MMPFNGFGDFGCNILHNLHIEGNSYLEKTLGS